MGEGSVRGWEKRGRETGYSRGWESGEIGNEFATLCNILQ